MSDDAFQKFFSELVESERQIIGPVAVTIAKQAGLAFSERGEASFSGSGKEIAEKLVLKFHELEGPVAYTIAKQALEKTRQQFPDFSLPPKIIDEPA